MTLEEITPIISSGSKADIKEAVKTVESTPHHRRKPPILYKDLLFWVISNFDSIVNPTNQVASLKIIQYPISYIGSKNYHICSNFILKVLQHSDGRVREQAHHTAHWFLMGITPDDRSQSKRNLKEKPKQFIEFILKIDKASEKHKKESGGLIYLNGMKPCPYKSLQKFLHRITSNEWLLKYVHIAGYFEFPSQSEIFADDSKYWEELPSGLEFSDAEFVVRIKKGAQVKNSETTYQFKVIPLRNQKIHRIIQINPSFNLYCLAEAIIDSFDFDLDHCFGFFNQCKENDFLFGSTEKYELFTDMPDIEPTGAGSIEHTPIRNVWTHIRKKMYFLFDYGDSWIFEVDLINVDIDFDRVSNRPYEILKSVGKSPEQYPQEK